VNTSPWRLRFALVLLLAPRMLSAAWTDVAVDAQGNATVDVIVELTDAGRKVGRPTPGHPAYYIPISAGYDPGGQLAFWNRRPPTDANVFRELAKELAGQSYLVATHEHRPSLILVVSWGYMGPRVTNPGAYREYIGGRAPRPITIPLHAMANVEDMLALTAGARSLSTWEEADRGAALSEAVIAAGVPRYYTKVVALKYSDWVQSHQYAPLWIARVSAPYWGCFLDEALPVFFKTGAPMFGRDMSAPQLVKTAIVPQGRVIVGTAVVANGVQKPNPASPATP